MWVRPSLDRGFSPELSPPLEVDVYPHWRMYRDFGGGMVTDWGAHMMDIAQWGLDMDLSGPVEFIPPTKRAEQGMKMIYDNGVVLNHVDWGENNATQFIG